MNRKAALLVILVFALGLALGGMSMRLAADRFRMGHPGPKDPARAVEELTRELDLMPEQQKQLKTILEETRAKFHAIYEQFQPQMEEVRQQGRKNVRAILTKEQLPKFEAWLERHDAERKKRSGAMPEGPPGRSGTGKE